MTSPLEMILESLGNIRDDNRRTTMAHVDVIERLEMNARQQNNFDRMDAQVDAVLKAKNGCYEPPPPQDIDDESDMERVGHRINSPIINIGVEAAASLAKSIESTPAAENDTGPKPSTQLSEPTMPTKKSRIPDWVKTAALLAAGAGTVAAINYLFPGADLDTRNIFDLEVVPFNPETPSISP